MTTGVVVLCDVRASRKIADRVAFLARLEETLARANRARDALVGAFDLQAGLDEFAGVLRPGRAGAVLPHLWEDLHPVAVRFAVVQGGLDVTPGGEGDRPPGAAGFDGPAFHRANELLDELRGREQLVAIRVGRRREDRLLTSVGDLLYARILGWTERQLEVVRAYRAAASQRDAARELGVSQSTVSRSLSSAQHGRVEAARRTFVEELDDVSREASRDE